MHDVSQEPAMPAISVLIPTYNRADTLLLCLEHLERQTMTAFEVILVDDGSTDATGTLMAGYLASPKLPLQYHRQPNRGPAVARNVAVTMARAPLVVFIGDDILVGPEFLAIHLAHHRRNPAENVAALGLTRWSEAGQTVTPFMHWMDSSGSQFAYGDLLRGTTPEWRHFYTSNLSVKTALLRRNPFDERFSKELWMMEDMELGYRLEQREGLRLDFLPAAMAGHIHPTDFTKACRRAFGAGQSARLFDEIWPERPLPTHGRLHRLARSLLVRNAWLRRPVTAFTAAVTRIWCPNPLLHPVLAYHAAIGRDGHHRRH